MKAYLEQCQTSVKDHYVKSVQIRIRKTPYLDTFDAVEAVSYFCILAIRLRSEELILEEHITQYLISKIFVLIVALQVG